MATSERYTCEKCGYVIEAWDEGNPYIWTKDGRRHYFYHPMSINIVHPILVKEAGRELTGPELEALVAERIGNASDYLCPDCGKSSTLDPTKDRLVCRKCGSTRIFDIWQCQGKPCPKCGGPFSAGRFGAIS
jgi:ribosomal protein S27AE